MNRDKILRDDLINDQTEILPVCLCIDTSQTMAITRGGRRTGEYTYSEDLGKLVPVVEGGTSRIDMVEDGIQCFYDAIFEDELARMTVLVSIVTFDDYAKKVQNFVPVIKKDGEVRKTPHFKPDGKTSMGEGINLALDLLEKRKKECKDRGVDCYQPWLIIMSDGINTGSTDKLAAARKRIQTLVEKGKLAVYPFGIGNEADMEQLNSLSPEQEAFRLEAAQMKGMFTWFAKSAVKVSSGSIHNASPKLEYYEVVSWTKGL